MLGSDSSQMWRLQIVAFSFFVLILAFIHMTSLSVPAKLINEQAGNKCNDIQIISSMQHSCTFNLQLLNVALVKKIQMNPHNTKKKVYLKK